MDITTYLDQAGRGAAARLARDLQVKPVVVARWRKKKKPVPLRRCAAIEVATQGAVPRWDCRPNDWFIHWPELIGSEGAPDVPERASEGNA